MDTPFEGEMQRPSFVLLHQQGILPFPSFFGREPFVEVDRLEGEVIPEPLLSIEKFLPSPSHYRTTETCCPCTEQESRCIVLERRVLCLSCPCLPTAGSESYESRHGRLPYWLPRASDRRETYRTFCRSQRIRPCFSLWNGSGAIIQDKLTFVYIGRLTPF
jgi:hypothetical protein